VLTGFVATTRVYLGAHNLMQVYTGFLVGIMGQIFGIFFFQ
jgi:membrane-associated phospholipid phosphatase